MYHMQAEIIIVMSIGIFLVTVATVLTLIAPTILKADCRCKNQL